MSYIAFDKVLTEYFRSAQQAQDGVRVGLTLCRDKSRRFTYGFYIAPSLEKTERICVLLAKTLFYLVGGSSFLTDSPYLAEILPKHFAPNGDKSFDYGFCETVFGEPMTFTLTDKLPETLWITAPCGGNTLGRRIGLDVGASSIKVCAKTDGRVIFENSYDWQPKLYSDASCHFNRLKNAVNDAYTALCGKADSLGVSTAGAVYDNELRLSSILLGLGEQALNQGGKTVYKDVAACFNLPLSVANDGDVTALGGAKLAGKGKVLGISLGTSEAGGYVDGSELINGWLNELAFIPVDYATDGYYDEWSKDTGVGAKYLCQEGVISLAKAKGFSFDGAATSADRYSAVKKAADLGNADALDCYKTLGLWLADGILLYSRFLDVDTVLITGGVTSGVGGDVMIEETRRQLDGKTAIRVVLPKNENRRFGQSYTATEL